MPATIDIHDDRLVVNITGPDKLWAFKSHLEIPMENVAGVRPGAEEARWWLQDMHVGGTHMPKHISAGTFYLVGTGSSGTSMIRTRQSRSSFAITDYRKLVLEVSDPLARSI